VLACLFYEPSTRTSASFIAAMERLGGSVIPITQGVQFSSVSKGETLADTIQTLEQYSDVIVLRHPEIGSARVAAEAANIPVINAGDGAGEHPTQALLDLFTIQEEMGRIDGLKIAMVGDLRFGRTVHSLTKLLLHFDVSLRFVSPEILRMPLKIMNEVRDAGVNARETHDVADVIENADVLYVTRVQKERFSDLAQYDEVKDHYVISPELMRQAKEKMIVMHPLPRVGEITTRWTKTRARLTSARCRTACTSAWRCWRPCWAGPERGWSLRLFRHSLEPKKRPLQFRSRDFQSRLLWRDWKSRLRAKICK
jgi:aspartate carbamoyltransferase catalytic subunit